MQHRRFTRKEAIERVRDEMKKRRLTNQDLGDLIGRTEGMIRKMLNGNASDDTLNAACLVLDIQVIIVLPDEDFLNAIKDKLNGDLENWDGKTPILSLLKED